jgi:hypothetical protein
MAWIDRLTDWLNAEPDPFRNDPESEVERRGPSMPEWHDPAARIGTGRPLRVDRMRRVNRAVLGVEPPSLGYAWSMYPQAEREPQLVADVLAGDEFAWLREGIARREDRLAQYVKPLDEPADPA